MQIQQNSSLLIGDDQPLTRDELTRLIRGEPDLSVIAEGANGRDAVLALNGCKSHPADRLPAIEFTEVPPAAQGGREKVQTIAGRVTGARPAQQIVVYARSGAWWVQPTVASPFVPIRGDSTWSTEITIKSAEDA